MKRKHRIFGIDITDTFGGESNYCWVYRFNVTAKTERGAMRKIGREFGYAWRNVGADRWDALGACICAFILDYPHDPERVTVKEI
jgi:hypothetical protein